MKSTIGPAEEWDAEIFTITPEYKVPDHIQCLEYRTIRTAAFRWLKEGKQVRFGLKCKANNRSIILNVERCRRHVRVNVDGDLVTFGDAVIIMKEKMEEKRG
jgi:hypothetical protein